MSNKLQSDIERQLTSRCRRLNSAPIGRDDGQYVLCWLQQTLRGAANPVIDAAIALGNSLDLPVVVYHGIGQHYPHASDRLHQFILEASYSLERDVNDRGLRFLRVVERQEQPAKGLVYRLATAAAALVIDDLSAFVGRWQAMRVAKRLDIAVIAVDAARLVPEQAIGCDCPTTRQFRARVGDLREEWSGDYASIEASVAPFENELASRHDALGHNWRKGISTLIRECDIDHSLPAASWCTGTREAGLQQLYWAGSKVIPGYASNRNNPAVYGTTCLSPYLHFGVLGPQDVVGVASQIEAPRDQWKFLDELLVWREFFHHTSLRFDDPTAFGNFPEWARQTLALHASDPRPVKYDLHALVHGQTDDETWNAAQRQFLIDGWMHNNLRMYWGKRLIEWTETPEAAWDTACYLNDRFSLDGRDPATYGNLRWCFGSGRPAAEVPIYGSVSRKSDRIMRSRPGVNEWLFTAARREGPMVSIPEKIPVWSQPQASGKTAVPYSDSENQRVKR
ncbi:hypothetical protein ACUNV4_26420 [Granulosicoccus sp. 3-233]|uniref:hypothetical protein n=1 Tax=Granulosicoccus sp. 3-233 TaxID=3417969 RepID=UPI003D33E994